VLRDLSQKGIAKEDIGRELETPHDEIERLIFSLARVNAVGKNSGFVPTVISCEN
jgi:hypothetical protein